MSTVIYVVSDGSNHVDRYKIGSHTGSCEKLISRYITAIPELIIHCFIETKKAPDIELRFKTIYKDKRILNIKGNYSEWYLMPLNSILLNINKLLNINFSIVEHEVKGEEKDKQLIEKLENEGIKLVDKGHGINFRKPSDIPSGKEYDKYRELFKATNRFYKREQRKRDENKASSQHIMHITDLATDNQININASNNCSRQKHIYNQTMSYDLSKGNNIITTTGFIMEIVEK